VGQPEKRQSALLAALLVVVLAITARLVYVQMVAGPSLAAAAEQEYTRSYTEHGARGDIVAADGNILATSVQTYQIRSADHPGRRASDLGGAAGEAAVRPARRPAGGGAGDHRSAGLRADGRGTVPGCCCGTGVHPLLHRARCPRRHRRCRWEHPGHLGTDLPD